MEIWKEWIENPKYLISSEGKIKGLNGKIMKTKKNILNLKK